MHCCPRIQCWEKPSSPLCRHGRLGWGRNTQGAFEQLPWPRIWPACFYGNRRQARSLLLGAKSLAAVRLSCWLPAGTWKCPFPKPIPCWLWVRGVSWHSLCLEPGWKGRGSRRGDRIKIFMLNKHFDVWRLCVQMRTRNIFGEGLLFPSKSLQAYICPWSIHHPKSSLSVLMGLP